VLRRMARTGIASPRQGSGTAKNAVHPGSAPQARTVRVRTPLATGRKTTVNCARVARNARAALASIPSDRTSIANQRGDGLTTVGAHLIRTVRVAHVLRRMARTGIASPRQGSGTAKNAVHPGSAPQARTVRVRTPLATGRKTIIICARAAGNARAVPASILLDRTAVANQVRGFPTTVGAHIIRTVRVAHVFIRWGRTRNASPRQGLGTTNNALQPGSVPGP